MRIAFVGGGNMASALIGGLLARGGDAGSITVIEPLAAQRAELERRFGVPVVTSNLAVIEAIRRRFGADKS
jgi:pyrroline-5-carboxylate reductase